jgi:hypothetical protein
VSLGYSQEKTPTINCSCWKNLRAVARAEMGGFWTNRFVENGFYHKPVSLGLGSLENGLTWVNTRANFLKMGRYTYPVETGVFSYFSWK